MWKIARLILVCLLIMSFSACYRAELEVTGKQAPPYQGEIKVLSETPYNTPYREVGRMKWTGGTTYIPEKYFEEFKAEAKNSGADVVVIPQMVNKMLPGTESAKDSAQFAVVDVGRMNESDVVLALRTLDKDEVKTTFAKPENEEARICKVVLFSGGVRYVDSWWYSGTDFYYKRGDVHTKMKLGDVDYYTTIKEARKGCEVW